MSSTAEMHQVHRDWCNDRNGENREEKGNSRPILQLNIAWLWVFPPRRYPSFQYLESHVILERHSAYRDMMIEPLILDAIAGFCLPRAARYVMSRSRDGHTVATAIRLT